MTDRMHDEEESPLWWMYKRVSDWLKTEYVLNKGNRALEIELSVAWRKMRNTYEALLENYLR